MIKVLITENSSPFKSLEFELFESQLPSFIMTAAHRFKRWQDAQAYLCGRYLLLQGLIHFGYKPDLLTQLHYTRFDRPYLPVPLDFNISHSGNYVICALSTHRIGVDIELVRPVELNNFAGCFTTEELCCIENSTDSTHEFYKYWTIKEAAVKADGRGLQIPLNTLHVSDMITIEENSWYIHKIEVDAAYQSYLATNAPQDQQISIERLSIQY